uniref:Uncharacterized protein n=1 Tax=Phlebotomus papatasi TaxID=29031 RepID=A0A1B0CYM1_PHLPP
MTDSMKFGPEWLRNMSNDTGTGTGNSAQRHQLAEFRYGREEMLSLFDKNIKIPEILPKFKNLFVEKVQCPLALTPTTEDDLRVWQVRSSPGLGLPSRGLRGGLMDRGRGRGRSSYHSLGGYQRSTSLYDDEGRIIGRNWRRSRLEEETPEGWRSTSISGAREKWARSTSWREEEPGELSSLRGYNSDRGFGSGTRMIPTGTGRKFWDQDDNLPEWAMENPLESGGSFDATGAFHGSNEEIAAKEAAENNIEVSPSKNRRKNNKPGSSYSGSDNNENDSEKSGNDEGFVKDSGPVRENGEEKEKNENIREKVLASKEDSMSLNPNVTTVSQEKVATVIVTTSTTIFASSIVTTTEARCQKIGQECEKDPPPGQMKEDSVEISSVDRMQEVADDMVEKLIMEDELVASMAVPNAGACLVASVRNKMHSPMVKEAPTPVPIAAPPLPPIPQESDSNLIWFYRDPQDMVQGPFTAIEMAEWYQAGYFDDNLCVRRMGDQRFSKLGELLELCGGEMPFFAPYRILPQQINEHPLTTSVNLLDDASVAMNFQMLRQHYIIRQQSLVYQKLSTSDFWHMLSAEQQREMINKQVAHIGVPDNIYSLLASMPADSTGPHNHPMGLHELVSGNGGSFGAQNKMLQMQQHPPTAKLLNSTHQPQQPSTATIHPIGPFGGSPHVSGQGFPQQPSNPPTPNVPGMPQADAMKQFLQNMNIGTMMQQQSMTAPMSSHRVPIVPQIQSKNDQQSQNDRIKSLILQLSMQKGMSQASPSEPGAANQWTTIQVPPEDILTATSQKQPHWMGGGMHVEQQGRGMWDLSSAGAQAQQQSLQIPLNSEMKTEKHILEEQQITRTKEEHSGEDFFDQRPLSPEQQNFSRDVKQEMQKVNKGKEEKKYCPSDVKKVEEKVKSQSVQDEKIAKVKKVAEPKNQVKSKEEDKRREEKPSAQEEKKDITEVPKKVPSGNTKSISQGQAVGKNKTSKSSVAPWSNSDLAAPELSLAEIQKAEMEHRAEQSRFEHMLREQQQQQRLIEMQSAKESVLPKWNAQTLGTPVVKSLAEIQAEEQAKAAAAEREHQMSVPVTNQGNTVAPKGSIKREEATALALGSIWNNTAQSLSWNSGKLWGGTSSSGFWEEPTKSTTTFTTTAATTGGTPSVQKALAKSQTMTNIQTAKTSTPPSTNTVHKQPSKQTKSANSASSKNHPGATIKNSPGASGKTTSTRKDDGGMEFTTWCIKALSAINSTVDRETKECSEFAKQFLERRSKYKNQIRAQNAHVDDMCVPAPAITPSTDCQEVKMR